MSETRKALVVLGAGLALVAVLWLAAIGPKRGERSELRDQVAAQESRLDGLQQEVASHRRARDGFPALLAELRDLDVAVPARGELASLLRGLQRRARNRGVELRVAALKSEGPAADPSAPATETPATPGAAPGPAGLAGLPFELTFTGEYFELLHLLATVRRAVAVADDGLDVRGRLLTIDGLSLRRPERGSPVTTATLSATAYVAPDSPAAPAAGDIATTASAPVTAAAPTAGGS